MISIDAGQLVISRDVNFDESVFGFLSRSLDENVDDLHFQDLDIDDCAVIKTEYKQTEKRKNCTSVKKNSTRKLRAI